MEPIIKHIHMVPDCEEDDEYFLFDSPEADEQQILILVRQNQREQTRTIEAVFTHEDRAVVDQWATDVQTICEDFRPPMVTFMQFVSKVAVALKLLPEDHDDVEGAPVPWAPEIVRELAKGLQHDSLN